MELGYMLVNYHTGEETFEALTLKEIVEKAQKGQEKETASGFYYFLVVQISRLASGGVFFGRVLEKIEVKTATDLETLISKNQKGEAL